MTKLINWSINDDSFNICDLVPLIYLCYCALIVFLGFILLGPEYLLFFFFYPWFPLLFGGDIRRWN